MSQHAEQAAAFVLHSRPYRETSLLVDLFTLEHGRISVVARGARRSGSARRFTLQPFQALHVSWAGRHELKNLSQAEVPQVMAPLVGKALLCGLYANELLQRLLQPADPHPRLYLYYTYLIQELQQSADLEGALRTFERQLLENLGYGIGFSHCHPGCYYQYDTQQGMIEVTADRGCYTGTDLLAIAEDRYETVDVRRAAKRLMREALAPLLGVKPLKSRELFIKTRRTA
ncbi:DNA repair protein RecO [Nitrincola sp. A-D6]|uniref:DNA repair protein RecO n=1 Tax=Nitrincola sp. A-D6 TaxID=1545442 RepID=UPI00051FDB24|nr:DNA repair protein RecO [Nitrincola sp. A-D6]KGK43332.1 DNA repair protein RecO [Nitrincola sp. A-D6]